MITPFLFGGQRAKWWDSHISQASDKRVIVVPIRRANQLIDKHSSVRYTQSSD
jgi:hypothetical protein